MAIPPFVSGVLPPGTFTATLREVVAVFDQPGSVTRQALNLALEHAATLIWSDDPAAIIYVNGSYATGKLDPVDVDLAVRSDVWDDLLFLSAFSSRHPGEEMLVDFYFNRSRAATIWKSCFGRFRDRAPGRALSS